MENAKLKIEDKELDAYYHGPLPKAFNIGPAHYTVDNFGVISQQPPYTMPKYDVGYVAERYDTIPENVAAMAHLRLGFLAGIISTPLANVLDVGYGNGAFLRTMLMTDLRCVGTDISGYPVPEGCEFMDWERALKIEWDLVTFFDSLEHFPSLDFLGELMADWVAITVPCVREDATVDWLATWKHLRPGEHLHHFRPSALAQRMRACGYREVAMVNVEDVIRRPVRVGEMNTFTTVFRKRKWSKWSR